MSSPSDALRMAEDAARQLALSGIIAAAVDPLKQQVAELLAENAALASALEVCEARCEELRRGGYAD